MENLPLSNILHRKTRTLLTATGVALGVVLVVITVGLVHGFLADQGSRNAAVTAEIMLNPAGGSFGLELSPTLSLKTELINQLKAVPGVSDAAPVGRFARGLKSIEGVDYESFSRVLELRIVEGRPALS